MTLQSVQKISRSGNALIVNIPQKIVDIMQLKMGDYLNIDWGEKIENPTKKVPKRIKKEGLKELKEASKLPLPDIE